MGDMLQFIRFAASAKEQGASGVLQSVPFSGSCPLLSRCPGIVEIVPEGTFGAPGAPSFDVQIPVMSFTGECWGRRSRACPIGCRMCLWTMR